MIRQYQYYLGTLTPRAISELKPGIEKFIGNTIRVQAGWLIEDLPQYEGEYAMIVLDEEPIKEVLTWVASGDLTRLVVLE